MKKFSILLAATVLVAGGLLVSCQKKKDAPCMPTCQPCQPSKQPSAPCKPSSPNGSPCKPGGPCRRY